MSRTRTVKRTIACQAVLEAVSTGRAGTPNTGPEDDMPWGSSGLRHPSHGGAAAYPIGDIPWGDMPWG